MLDIRRIRENPEEVKKALKTRNADYDKYIDEILEIDVERRKISTDTDVLKARQNKVSKEIPVMKKNGEDVSAILAEMNEIKEKIKAENAKISELEERQRFLLLSVPNIPSATTPIGKDDSENVEIRKFGEPTKFDFEPLAHWDLGKQLGILDPETAAKVTGARFHFYKGLGAKLERAIISYFLTYGKRLYRNSSAVHGKQSFNDRYRTAP